ETFRRAALADQGGGDDREMEFLSLALQRDLLRGWLAAAPPRAGQPDCDGLEVRPLEHGLSRLADDRTIEAEQPRRRGIDGRDGTARVHRDHTGRDPLEDGFDIASAAFHLVVLAFELDRRALALATAGRKL